LAYVEDAQRFLCAQVCEQILPPLNGEEPGWRHPTCASRTVTAAERLRIRSLLFLLGLRFEDEGVLHMRRYGRLRSLYLRRLGSFKLHAPLDRGASSIESLPAKISPFTSAD